MSCHRVRMLRFVVVSVNSVVRLGVRVRARRRQRHRTEEANGRQRKKSVNIKWTRSTDRNASEVGESGQLQCAHQTNASANARSTSRRWRGMHARVYSRIMCTHILLIRTSFGKVKCQSCCFFDASCSISAASVSSVAALNDLGMR